MKRNTHHLALSALSLALGLVANSSYAMQELSEQELSDVQGQALLMMSRMAPSGLGTGANTTDYEYLKLGMEAKMELNANIRSLQLGCGGINGVGECDIDIENLSLSGPADGKTTTTAAADPTRAGNGVPTWSQGRANTSAVVTNPFIEFAIKNPDTAAKREIVGFRLSAEEILGHLSAGVWNDKDSITQKSTGGGINTYSGYLQVGVTPVSASTKQTQFGTVKDQVIYAKITALGNNRTVTTNVNGMTVGQSSYKVPPSGYSQWGITVESQAVNFNFPKTAVTGNRMSQLDLVVRDVPISSIAIGEDSGAIQMRMDQSILGLASNPVFYMGDGKTQAQCATTRDLTNCSYIDNLKVNVTVKQNFNLVHNLPITSGGYLSLQKEALRWPGSASAFKTDLTKADSDPLRYVEVADNYTATATEIMNYGDIAQPGWWLSFKDPLDFGALNPTEQIEMGDVLPQIATFITNYLSNNNISLGFFDAVGAGLGAPVKKGIGAITLANDARAVMVLQNLQLDGNQKPVPNCWGNLKFC